MIPKGGPKFLLQIWWGGSKFYCLIFYHRHTEMWEIGLFLCWKSQKISGWHPDTHPIQNHIIIFPCLILHLIILRFLYDKIMIGKTSHGLLTIWLNSGCVLTKIIYFFIWHNLTCFALQSEHLKQILALYPQFKQIIKLNLRSLDIPIKASI